jgi:transposase InsO family protein
MQCCSEPYQANVRAHRMHCSSSAKGNCHDNACAETLFPSLKVEAIRGRRVQTHEDARRTLFEYIEIDYNRPRPHSANGYLRLADYGARHLT